MVHFDLEKLEELPSKELPFNKWKRSYRNYNGYDKFFGKRNPYFTARKIAQKNIGKSFDNAFSYYCKNVRQEDQKEFIELFDGGRWNDYIIDELGLIQLNPSRLPVISESKRTFKSDNIEYKTIHKDSGLAKELFKPVEIIVGYREILQWAYDYSKRNKRKQKRVIIPIKKQIGWEYIGKDSFYIFPFYKRIFAKDSDFITVVSKGIELKFDSPKDPHLVRLRAEKKKKHDREFKKKRNTDITDYDFILKQGEQRLIKENNDKLLTEKEMAAKLKQENEIKILAHGFDLETSFRTVISWKKKNKKDLVDNL